MLGRSPPTSQCIATTMTHLLATGRRGLRLPGAVLALRSGAPFSSVPADEESSIYAKGNTTGKRELFGPLCVQELPGRQRTRGARARIACHPPLLSAAAPRPLTPPAPALPLPPPPGKGRGVAATGAIELGDLLTWAAPAAVLHGPVEEQPDAALLAPQLLALRAGSLPWAARAALEHLDDGSGGLCVCVTSSVAFDL